MDKWRFILGTKYLRAVEKGIFSNILAVQIKICWYVYSGSTQNLYIVYTLPTGVLTVNQTCAIERVQKTCFSVILAREYIYRIWVCMYNLEILEVRRKKLSFGKKWLLNSNLRSLFPRKIPLHNHNHWEQNLFTVVQDRTERLRRSSISYISKDYWIAIDNSNR